MQAPHAALVRIEGTIDANANANAERVIKGLRSAFDNESESCFVHRGGRDQAMMSGEGEGIAFDTVWCFK
jgi:hypothetical protein